MICVCWQHFSGVSRWLGRLGISDFYQFGACVLRRPLKFQRDHRYFHYGMNNFFNVQNNSKSHVKSNSIKSLSVLYYRVSAVSLVTLESLQPAVGSALLLLSSSFPFLVVQTRFVSCTRVFMCLFYMHRALKMAALLCRLYSLLVLVLRMDPGTDALLPVFSKLCSVVLAGFVCQLDRS